MRSWAAIAAVGLAFSSLAIASSRSQKERGTTIFKESGCQHCHTIGGVGGHKGPDLSGVGRRRSKAAMRDQIEGGSKVMPAFGDVLGPEELNDVIAYLRSCRAKPAKAARASNSN
ncbi:MAG: cytochrome c [Terracidiphilus sp.]|jgi:ubiquinol-cytochrome c reductase cytochrome b subunit